MSLEILPLDVTIKLNSFWETCVFKKDKYIPLDKIVLRSGGNKYQFVIKLGQVSDFQYPDTLRVRNMRYHLSCLSSSELEELLSKILTVDNQWLDNFVEKTIIKSNKSYTCEINYGWD